MSVQIPVEAKLDSAEIDKVLQKLTEQMNRLGNAVAQANKIKFNPISQAALTDLQKVTHQFDSLRKISGDLGKRLKATGQGSTGFFDLDWKRLYTDPSVRARKMRQQFEYVTAGTGASFTSSTPSPPGITPRTPRPPEPPAPPPSPGASWRQAGRGVVGAGLRAAGPVGGVADSAISSGMSGGAMAGLAGLVGGIAALGVGKLIGGIANKVGDAQNDAIGYDTLKRVLGDVNVSFGVLQQSLHASSDAIDVTYPQILKLGNEFAHISGISGKLAEETLAKEAMVGGGFGRSFGMDPSQSNAFFAQMRQFKVTNNEEDSRRLALTIGEAIAKSGAFSKADEMLQAIASYTAQQTRMGMVSANMAGYSAMLSGMVGSHIPGFDPTGAASTLSKVNSSIANGGNAGEAGQNFLYMAVGKPLGLDPIMTKMLLQQGAFGTGATTFGKKSPIGEWALANGVNISDKAKDSSQTNLSMVLSRINQIYGKNPQMKELATNAAGNLFGLNESTMATFSMMKPSELGGLQKALIANGIDPNKMSPTGISSLAQIYSGDRGTLKDQADQLRPQLSDEDAAKLDDSEKGGTEKFRSELMKLVATYGQSKTEGSETRTSINNLNKNLTDQAAKLLVPLNTMRDMTLLMFGKRGSMTADDIHKKVLEAQRKDINDRADDRIGEAKKASSVETLTGVTEFGAPIYNSITHDDARLKASTAAANKDRYRQLAALESPNLINELAETDRIVGLTPGTSAAQMMQESGFDSHARSSKGAMGMAQVMPDTLARLETPKYLNRKLDPENPEDAVLIQRELMRENMKKFGNEKDALRAYNGGWDKSKWNNSETNGYISKISDYTPYFANAGTPLPAGIGAPGVSQQTHDLNINITGTLNHPTGQPGATLDPVKVTKKVGAPMAFGSTGSW